MSEKHTCEAVTRSGHYPRGHYSAVPCGRPAKTERDGKWYCGTHDPVKRKERDAKKYAKWDAEAKARTAIRDWEHAAKALCGGLCTETMLKLGPGWVAKKLKEEKP